LSPGCAARSAADPPIRRSAEEVERLVSGASAYICDACIADCVAILEQHGGFAGARPVN
jgi:hypothetical protein